MKIYKKQNVYEAAKDRIRYLLDEFDQFLVSVSGGKDSTVVFHLTLEVAREMGCLPVKTFFLDQEAEWAATIEQIRYHMYHEDVEPMWFQIPFKLFNATSSHDHWLHCWNPDEEHLWIHPKDPVSYKENVYGIERFRNLMDGIIDHHFPDQPTAAIAGVRTEESPVRMIGLTRDPTYKWITWGSKRNKKLNHYLFYPIYDWSYTDVWKYIHDNDLPYNRIYDAQYSYGLPLRSMRVSNVHHETAVQSLFYMQELEADTWNRLTARVDGVDMASKMGKADYFVKDLPFMFASWREYRDYLLEKLIDNEEWKDIFRKKFAVQEKEYLHHIGDAVFKVHVHSILTNDWEGIKLDNFNKRPEKWLLRKQNRGIEPVHA